MIKTSTLRPGLLVSLSTSIKGNVQYERITTEHKIKGKSELSAWNTKKVVADKQEEVRAKQTVSLARVAITRVCTSSASWLLCPEEKADQLEAGIAEARRVVDEFNATAKLSRVEVHCFTGRVAADDVQAVKAIKSEVRDLLQNMRDGVKDMDVKKIRSAAGKAKSIGQMLTPDSQVRIQLAIDAARKAAKTIIKAGESAAVELDKQAMRQITESRTAFLDTDEAQPMKKVKGSARAVDFAPQTADEIADATAKRWDRAGKKSAKAGPQLEMD